MEKIACLDVGLKRIGIAFCFNSNIIIPQDAIQRRNRNQAAHDVSGLLKKWEIEKLIVGIPLSGSSCEEMQRRIKHFVSLLDFQKQIIFMDEYGSSFEAKEKIKGITKHKRDGRIDSQAACVILQRYLDKKN
ncbi:MAG: Holliday junction resolvase RuvX [Proteobacteria bacterium]|nr:MAG: Holliday junction resolvase RuvX [Pseudomonadota bacterium]